MLTVITSLRETFNKKGDVVGLLSFPFIASLTYIATTKGFPHLSPAVQNAIENGTVGMLLGIVWGAVVLGAACATWDAAKALRTPAH